MLRYHEIAEAAHRILNPFTDQKLDLLGQLCRQLVLADGDSWDRYAASQWWTIERWLHAHPDHPDPPAMREFLDRGRRAHLEYGRDHLGWGVFVLRPVAPERSAAGPVDGRSGD